MTAARRPLGTAYALLLLLGLSTVTLNLHVAHPWSHDGFSPFDVALDGRHAEEPAHLEPSAVAERPACLACLLEKTSEQLDRPRYQVGPELTLVPRPIAAPCSAIRSGHGLPHSGRGPPAA